jgi:hypothetical protein
MGISMSFRGRLARLERQFHPVNPTVSPDPFLTDEERVEALRGFLRQCDFPDPFPLLEGACWLEAFAPLYEASKVEQTKADS